MIITKTPYRISFFGGGSDYPEWFDKNQGEVISATINKFIYISCRYLPHFFRHKYRVVYSKIENVKNYNQIKHNAVKQILKYYKVNDGLEIHYDGDLPARSGMGSSSCFVVGLLHALMKLKNKKINSNILSTKSILKIVDRAKKSIKQNNCDDFGSLLHETWVEKRTLSKSVTTNKIDHFYDKGLKNGALGGKLLGAGGGGFILFYVEDKKIPMFKRAFSSNILVPINMSDKGSEVIFYEK